MYNYVQFLMLEEEDELLLQLHLSQSIVNHGFTVEVSYAEYVV